MDSTRPTSWERIVHLHGKDWAWDRLSRAYTRTVDLDPDGIGRANVRVCADVISKSGWIVEVTGVSSRWHTRAQIGRFAKTRCLAMILADRYVGRIRSLLIKLMKDKQYAEGWGWPTSKHRIFGCCKKRRNK